MQQNSFCGATELVKKVTTPSVGGKWPRPCWLRGNTIGRVEVRAFLTHYNRFPPPAEEVAAAPIIFFSLYIRVLMAVAVTAAVTETVTAAVTVTVAATVLTVSLSLRQSLLHFLRH